MTINASSGNLLATLALAAAMSGAGSRQVHGQDGIVSITASEYAISAPDSVRAGVLTLRLTQTGDARRPWPGDTVRRRADPTYSFHMVWLVRLDSGRTASDLYHAELRQQPTAWATVLGGVGFAQPPIVANATLRVAPGTYALVCYVGSAREDRTRYHLLKGMFRPLVVTGPELDRSLPAPDLIVTLESDSVIVPPIRAGRLLVAVRNNHSRRADFGITRIKQGRTVADALAWRPRLMSAPPYISIGGVVAVPVKGELLTEISLEPGQYLFNNTPVIIR